MNFAGLWASWHEQERGEELRTCTITTGANALMRPFHDRMPVMLADASVDRWLDPELTDPTELSMILEMAPGEELFAYPVSPKVNSTRNEGPELAVPVGPRLQAA
jgi:putative SOS response-associated peptidase YedK